MKIAILGKGDSRPLAPFHDDSWAIWGCGIVVDDERITYGGDGRLRRWDEWFELHNGQDYTPNAANPVYRSYRLWLERQTKPINTLGTLPIDNATVLPKQQIIAHYGTYFLTNTIAWMMAYALWRGATELALYGVDQTSTPEYTRERHGVMHFMHLARHQGVLVTLPVGNPLDQPFKTYPEMHE